MRLLPHSVERLWLVDATSAHSAAAFRDTYSTYCTEHSSLFCFSSSPPCRAMRVRWSRHIYKHGTYQYRTCYLCLTHSAAEDEILERICAQTVASTTWQGTQLGAIRSDPCDARLSRCPELGIIVRNCVGDGSNRLEHKAGPATDHRTR